MNRVQLAAMIVAALSIIALLIAMARYDRRTQLVILTTVSVLLCGVGAYVLVTQPWHTEAWGYMNPIFGFYFLLLAVAPIWAALNALRAGRKH
ncbi:MAG: hypothetical protein RLZ98_1253 [Pseudomonadota bacterium]